MRWVRRGAECASEHGNEVRALALARVAAEIREHVDLDRRSSEAEAPGSENVPMPLVRRSSHPPPALTPVPVVSMVSLSSGPSVRPPPPSSRPGSGTHSVRPSPSARPAGPSASRLASIPAARPTPTRPSNPPSARPSTAPVTRSTAPRASNTPAVRPSSTSVAPRASSVPLASRPSSMAAAPTASVLSSAPRANTVLGIGSAPASQPPRQAPVAGSSPVSRTPAAQQEAATPRLGAAAVHQPVRAEPSTQDPVEPEPKTVPRPPVGAAQPHAGARRQAVRVSIARGAGDEFVVRVLSNGAAPPPGSVAAVMVLDDDTELF
jgi:hypothetical protein